MTIEVAKDPLESVIRVVHRPQFVDALYWDGSFPGADNIIQWIQRNRQGARFFEKNETSTRDHPEILVTTDANQWVAKPGDWIVLELDGTNEFSVYSADEFRNKFATPTHP